MVRLRSLLYLLFRVTLVSYALLAISLVFWSGSNREQAALAIGLLFPLIMYLYY